MVSTLDVDTTIIVCRAGKHEVSCVYSVDLSRIRSDHIRSDPRNNIKHFNL